ncbi:MAG: UDP-N-acetylglucosamine 2-epimerase (non-hydrolyzing) [Chitinispirillaceae bacterium]|nr:UDP-N-acetylglucosamine 2-epimerase (non-hydrolyzing) [Chitinispirillaceae bacterium]
MKKIFLVAGARPNFMKIAPIARAIETARTVDYRIVHTGQHYDEGMSGTFFNELGIPEPHDNLNVGSGSHAVQTANIMIRFEDVCLKERPDMVVVVGDVNSTVACGLVAKKLHIQLAHVEAGLRSRDRSMPEEINRIATDAIADLFFTTEQEGTENLLHEGHAREAVHFVGHVMIDNLYYQLGKLSDRSVSPAIRDLKARLGKPYACLTLHRPSNVDDTAVLARLINALHELAADAPIIFPCHPRTRKNLKTSGLEERFLSLNSEKKQLASGIVLLEPLGYNDFLYLWKDAALMLTDSGGLQEETTALKIPCITMRETTERPVTAAVGSNVVVGSDPEKIITHGRQALAGNWKKGQVPDLWDGRASERIVTIVCTPGI